MARARSGWLSPPENRQENGKDQKSATAQQIADISSRAGQDEAANSPGQHGEDQVAAEPAREETGQVRVGIGEPFSPAAERIWHQDRRAVRQAGRAGG